MAAIRNGILVLLICALPTSASAGCGLFSPCGSPSWIGFSLALPVPRLPHLHTFCSRSCQSPMCGVGQPVGCGLLNHGCCQPPCGGGCCPPAYAPPVLSTPPLITPQPAFPSTTCNPCEMGMAQTQLVPQQSVSYRDVPQIQYRQEAYTASVPVTTYQQVTRYRNVPYQTVARIPQISTQYVPQIASTPCNPCMAGASSYFDTTAALPYSPTPIGEPQMGGVPEYPYPVPQPQANAGDQWQTIPQRQADGTDVQQMGYYQQTLPRRTSSMFRPAPSATAAWQSRFLR